MAFELVETPIQYCDIETRQLKRRSEVTKNELMRERFDTCIRHDLKFCFVRMDSWFSATGNFEFSRERKAFYCSSEGQSMDRLDRNRLDRRGPEQQALGACRYGNCGADRGARLTQELCERSPCGAAQVFTNKDRSAGRLHLVCSDLTCGYDAIATTYNKRW